MAIKKSKGKTPLKTEKYRITFLLEEAVPESQQERKKYVADIAFFYSSIFKKKLQHFIGMQLEALATEGRPVVDDQFLRSSISVFRLIDEWMEAKTNEHIGNVTGIRNSLEGDQAFIKNIKDKINEN